MSHTDLITYPETTTIQAYVGDDAHRAQEVLTYARNSWIATTQEDGWISLSVANQYSKISVDYLLKNTSVEVVNLA